MSEDVLRAALDAAASGARPPAVALMHLLMEAPSEAAARAVLARAIARHAIEGDRAAAARLRALAAMWRAQPQAWSAVRTTIEAIGHRRDGAAPDDTLRYWAERFDRLVAAAPEASVALYALGSPALLAAATEEAVAHMAAWGLLGPDADVLDLGCGIGRFAAALAPRVRAVLGLDLSAGMVAEARRRHGAVPNLRFATTAGRDLAGVGDASVDLVLAADVFPYLVAAGPEIVSTHGREIARVLRPGGHALILNFSYRGDPAADRRDVAAMATQAGLAVRRAGTRDLSTWDAATFLLQRESTARRAARGD